MQIIALDEMRTVEKKLQLSSTEQGSLVHLLVEFDIIKNTVIDYTVTNCVLEYVNSIEQKIYKDKLDFYGLEKNTRNELEKLLRFEIMEMKQKGNF